MATLRKLRLPFFVVAIAISLAGVYSWASESMTLSCSVPEIVGLNTAAVEEEKAKEPAAQAKEEERQPLTQDAPLLAAHATIRTLYSR